MDFELLRRCKDEDRGNGEGQMRARALLSGSGVEWAEANTDTRGRRES